MTICDSINVAPLACLARGPESLVNARRHHVYYLLIGVFRGQALRQEVAYASYLNIPAIILPPPRNRSHVASYARIVNECLKNVPYMQFSVRLPIYDPAVFQHRESPSLKSHGDLSSSGASTPSSVATSPPKLVIPSASPPRSLRSSKAPEGELNATWEMWDIIRTVCDYNVRLTLSERKTFNEIPPVLIILSTALDLTPPLPVNAGVLNRWAAEPVQHIFLPASAFIANVKGYPVLPKGTQAFLRQSMIVSPSTASDDISHSTKLAPPNYRLVRR